jgi:O-antigen ligase
LGSPKVYYLLKTSSRGAFLGMGIMLLCTVIFSAKYRWRLLPIVLLTPLLLLAMPDDVIHRLTFVSLDSKNATATTEEEMASLASQREREELFRRSVEMMFQHPLFGVGVGEFMDAVFLDDSEKGQRSPGLGTHNSYTEVGSECGIPALIAYVALIVLSIRQSYRVFKRSAADPRLEGLSTAAMCIMASIVGYAAGTFFYHVAYGGTLPLLTGAAAGLWQAFLAEVKSLPDTDLALIEP